jgi:uncharacterized protein YjbI with pentapeptide repeats
MVDSNSLADRLAALQQQVERQATTNRLRFVIGTSFLVVIIVLLGITLRPGNSPGGKDVKELFWLLSHDGGTREERLEAFLALVEEGNTEWRIAQLNGLDLSGLELSGANLADATLDNCKLVDTNLKQANLYRVGLEAADLNGANLEGSNMREAWLLRASLVDAKLSGVDLVGASLQQVTATGADFSGAMLAETDLMLADLSGATLAGADLTGANMDAALLEGADLEGADFSGCGLLETDFTDTNWWQAAGLSVDLVAELRERYPPGERAPAEWRQDFEKWTSGYETANPALPDPDVPPADVEKPADE